MPSGIGAGVGLITATALPIAECYTFGAGVGKVVLYNESLIMVHEAVRLLALRCRSVQACQQ